MGLLLTTACDEVDDESTLMELAMRNGSLLAGMGLGDGESWTVSIDGEVKGWGQRYCDSTGCLEPLETAAIELPRAALEVHGNGSFTAARLDDGTVMGWGPTLADVDAPVPVDFEEAVVELALGSDFLCARHPGGEVSCRSLPGLAGPAWLTSMPAVTNAVALSAGAEHVCARRSSGSVVCWGSNAAGQLGPDGTGSLTLSGSVDQIAAGGQHTCARLDTGAVQCWGSNAQGQTGLPAGTAAGVVTVPLPEPAAMLAMGAEHGCAIGASSQSLYCWGSNAQGQLGQGQDSSSGIRQVDLGGLRATAVFAGATARTTFGVLETGGLRGWGNDDRGQMGYGDRFADDGVVVRNAGNLPDIVVYIPPDDPEPS